MSLRKVFIFKENLESLHVMDETPDDHGHVSDLDNINRDIMALEVGLAGNDLNDEERKEAEARLKTLKSRSRAKEGKGPKYANDPENLRRGPPQDGGASGNNKKIR